MGKTLVAYFSPGGTTAGVARQLAEAAGADLYEIRPQVPYQPADLDWRDANARSTLEMKDPASRPALADRDAKAGQYDRIFVGFPIWWYVAPTIINTFLEAYDLTGKTVVLFATSGGSGFGETASRLWPSCPGARIREGKVFSSLITKDALAAWLEEQGL